MDADLAGTTLVNRYDVLDLIGRGGMGAVYRARDRELDELVALKVIRAELAGDAAIVDRFRHEVKLARRVTHQNVARTFELGNAAGLVFCTMELVDGEPLARRLAHLGRLPVDHAITIVDALCDGLAAAHAVDVIHRDIKPDNVLIASDGRVVMADFGVAAVSVGDHGEVAGTPAYMAPEQARGERPTPAADIYAVGVVLFEMLTGRRAFTGDAAKVLADKQSLDALAIDGDVPAGLAAVIAQATARDPAARIRTAVALRRAITPWRPAQTPVLEPRSIRPTPARALTTVIVCAPTTSGNAQLYLAEAVHEALLARLAQLPRVRVLPRGGEVRDDTAIVIALHAGDMLAVAVTHPRVPAFELRLPLAIDHIDTAARAIADAVSGAFELGVTTPHATGDRGAHELLLRARHLAGSQDAQRVDEAIELLQRARHLQPDDPQIAGHLAATSVRQAFFARDADPGMLAAALALARDAVATGPHVADAHVGAGYAELHAGDPVAAAIHFRTAIACAPHTAEAHNYLGWMLLEAGYIDAALARLDEAIAIRPNLRSARWEIARAWALENRWDDHERIVAELTSDLGDRPFMRSRFAWWRGDRESLRTLAATIPRAKAYTPELLERLVAVFLDGNWAAQRDALEALVRSTPPNRRRRAFFAQLVAEAAAFSGDLATCATMIEYAIEHGLFDLHWMDRCPMLAPARIETNTAFARHRARIKERADAILDALYGDAQVAVSETALASS